MTGPSGEMPFLDHLEELRTRVIRVLLALIGGFAAGFYIVQQLGLITRMKEPIAPYLGTGGKLVVLSPTEPVMIVMKLSFVVGLVLTTPILLWQIWAFLAPALYEREKKAIVPALFVGTALFLVGAVLAWVYVLPQSLRILFSFQTEAIQPMITYDAYFGFVVQVVLALGISFELPLIIFLLAWLGIATPARLNGFRRYAIVLAVAAGAVLSPGTDVLTMMMFTIPLLVLYEVGFAGAVLLHRRRRRKAARMAAATGLLLLLMLGGGSRSAAAQDPVRPPPAARDSAARDSAARDSAARDSAARDSARPVPAVPDSVAPDSAARDSLTRAVAADSAAAAAGRPQVEPLGTTSTDTIIEALMRRRGYTATRYRADSAQLFAGERRLELTGSAYTEREGMTLEAERIGYSEESCILTASGKPRLVDDGKTLVGEGIRYDTCERRGTIRQAQTEFTEAGTVWFLRGDVAQDSSSTRIYAGSSTITSCKLAVPHYHFSARRVKWVSGNVIVARPVVLYIRDIPVLWLPFIFQDTRPGRHSGILVPKFGLNDIVRTSRSYNRQITNIGYYWAVNDYLDLTGRIDWYSGRYFQWGVTGQYNVLDRFMSGSLAYNRQSENGGGTANGIRWEHRQNFSISTSLNLDLNYVSNSAIVERNALDPLLNTQQISSSLNLSRRFGWGTVTLGGNRRENLSDNSSTTQLPSLTISPKPLDLSRNVTWSPGLSLVNDLRRGTANGVLLLTRPDGGVDTIQQTARSRATAFNLDTPLRLGSFNWRNAVSVIDRDETGRRAISFREPDESTPDPADSVQVNRVVGGDFETGVNWDTGINLPVLFRGTWRIQPAVGITNATQQSQFFAVRNGRTEGQYVFQGKRFQLSATASPTFFGFLGGIGPFSRLRHSLSPTVAWSYSPAASVSEEFARAIAQPGQPLALRSDPTQRISLGLSQNLEAKARTAETDSSVAPLDARKYRLLSISTSPIVYDFEQAKQPGRTGWVTDAVTNSLLSDLLPGFNLSLTHDLWRGAVGTDTAGFDPFLQAVSAGFSLSSRTFRAIGSFLGIATREPGEPDDAASNLYQPTGGRQPSPGAFGQAGRPASPGSMYGTDQIPLGLGSGRRFNATVNYSLNRTRTLPGAVETPAQQNVRLEAVFSPTAFWAVSWQTQYNFTEDRFESHVVRLERDLHEWRAAFNFVRNANGNVAFYFSIYLTDLPELKFDYNESTLGSGLGQ
jgi:sec-independent protein translocase protein TatC